MGINYEEYKPTVNLKLFDEEAIFREVLSLKRQLNLNDYKHIRQMREEALVGNGLLPESELTMNRQEYTDFCMEQMEAVKRINELEDILGEFDKQYELEKMLSKDQEVKIDDPDAVS